MAERKRERDKRRENGVVREVRPGSPRGHPRASEAASHGDLSG